MLNKVKKDLCYIVDFKIFFDTIDRSCLLYKLIKSGIGGKMCNILKAAFKNTKLCVKTRDGVTEYFTSTTGVQKGCILSYLLMFSRRISMKSLRV